HLDEFVDQALSILAVTIQSRGVQVDRHREGSSECVLLNGNAMARVILDLLLSAVRSVDIGARIGIALRPHGGDYVAFELSYEGIENQVAGQRGRSEPPFSAAHAHPGLQLAERTVHGCGGKLSLERSDDGAAVLRILLN